MATARLVRLGLMLILGTLAMASRAQALAELAAYDGPDRTVRLIAGAKKEDMLQFYPTIPPEYLKPIIDTFEKNTASRWMFGGRDRKRYCSA